MMSLPNLSLPSERLSPLLTRLEAELQYRTARNRLLTYRPYTKQKSFHAAGGKFRERAFMAGNQLGKTLAGGMEVAMHLTGKYPDWWEGKRFNKPNRWWAASDTGENTRKGPQRILIGEPADRNQWGTGTIPGADFADDPSLARGVADAIDSLTVKHITGGKSVLYFKAYEQGRQKWQNETLEGVWFDEEPPSDIYSEGVTRTNATGGISFITATPLLGMSDVVRQFYPQPSTPYRHLTQMTIDEAEHYTPEQRAMIVATYPEHEREARAKGIPMLGSGRVFPVAEGSIKVEPFEIPKHWAQIAGLDFGYDHPFGAVRLAHNRDTDTVYVTAAYRVREKTPAIHVDALRHWDIPFAWPHDGLQHDKGSGEELANQYRTRGLKLTPSKAEFPDDRGNGVEAGVMEMLDRMLSGRLKVFSNLEEWFEEFRTYHRDEGLIVKEHDDLLCATRYAIMMLRCAEIPRKYSPIKYPNLGLA